MLYLFEELMDPNSFGAGFYSKKPATPTKVRGTGRRLSYDTPGDQSLINPFLDHLHDNLFGLQTILASLDLSRLSKPFY
jgi:hypothetical protein